MIILAEKMKSVEIKLLRYITFEKTCKMDRKTNILKAFYKNSMVILWRLGFVIVITEILLATLVN